jgi:transcriptional regulator with XRE-family HTH domain
MSQTAAHLARNVLQLRESRGWSQEQAAKLCGIPRPTWSNLESGTSNHNSECADESCGCFAVSVEELIGPPKAECRFYAAKQLRSFRRGDALIRKILPDSLPGCGVDRMELDPGGRLVGLPHRTGTREYLTCERGEITLTVGGETWKLTEGDVVVFRGDQTLLPQRSPHPRRRLLHRRPSPSLKGAHLLFGREGSGCPWDTCSFPAEK